jgi:hypothetical protein
VTVEVGDGHLSREQEGHGPGEEAEQEEQAPDRLEGAGPVLRQVPESPANDNSIL